MLRPRSLLSFFRRGMAQSYHQPLTTVGQRGSSPSKKDPDFLLQTIYLVNGYNRGGQFIPGAWPRFVRSAGGSRPKALGA